MNEKEALISVGVGAVAIIMLILAGGWVFAADARNTLKQEAVDRGCAIHNSQTGKWEWVEHE